MTQEEIVHLLEEKHQFLIELLEHKLEDKWELASENKWTVGQHALHLLDAAKLLNKALSYPKFILKYKFGMANREVRTYEEVTKRYQDRLKENQERARDFNKDLKIPTIADRKRIIDDLNKQKKKLLAITRSWKDKKLDTLLLPHPLMGRMIVREIIMWSAYHTEHHAVILKEY
ncbi:MAG: DinB family protein [Flavobacteriaceae bacterium]|nr:DinB family protein [Flavobacteriaceae bacterium]